MSERSHRQPWPDESVGSLASEAGLLVEAVQDWVKGASFARLVGGSPRSAAAQDDPWAQATASAADPVDDVDSERLADATPGLAHGISDCPGCSRCPICRSVRLVQAAKPEVVEHLTDALSSVGAAIRTIMAEERRQRETRQTPRDRAPRDRAPGDRAPGERTGEQRGPEDDSWR